VQLWMIITYTKIKLGVSVPFVLIWHGPWAAGAVGFVSMTRRAFTDITLYSWASPLPARYCTHTHTHTDTHVAHCIHTRDQQDNHMLCTEVPPAVRRRYIAVGFYVLKRWKICTLHRVRRCAYILCINILWDIYTPLSASIPLSYRPTRGGRGK